MVPEESVSVVDYSVLQVVTLGFFYFVTGFFLRQSQLLGWMLFNINVWYGITQVHVEKLEEPDKMLLIRIFETPISTPVESLYLASGSISVSFILRGRHTMVLHNLITRDKTENLYKKRL